MELIDYNQAFNGDYFLYLKFAELVKKHQIELVIETGTYHGDTTKAIAPLVPAVLTTEIIKEYREIAMKNCADRKNITFMFGDSPAILGRVLPQHQSKKILFFLDSHWYDKVPLLPELYAIAQAGIEPVIMIHDFFVPEKSDPNNPKGNFGYDTYHGQAYTMEYVKSALDKIYPDGFDFEYNTECAGACRGCLFVYPKTA